MDGETLCCKKLKIKNLNTQDIESLVERLRNRSLYKDKATLEVMDLCMEAATVITDLLARIEAAEARAEKAEREKDAAVNDLRIFGHCCSCCKWFNAPNCKAKEPCGTNDNWEWRGLKEE